MVSEMKDGDILVLQNTRFRPEETKNRPNSARSWLRWRTAVDDAFGSAHRAHCSTVGVTDYIKETAGLPDGEGDQLPGQCRGAAGASPRGHPGRRQGRISLKVINNSGQGGYPHRRRRHGLYLPGGQGL